MAVNYVNAGVFERVDFSVPVFASSRKADEVAATAVFVSSQLLAGPG
jgi:hypothetical protein